MSKPWRGTFWAVVTLAAVAVAGGGCQWVGGGSSSFIVRPRPGWTTYSPGTTAQYRAPDIKADGRETPVNSPPVRTIDGHKVSLGGLIQSRQIIAEVARTRGLSPRVPTVAETRDGWTEIYSGTDRSAGEVRVREEKLGRSIEVSVREPNRGPSLRAELRQRLGLDAMPPAADPATTTR